MLGNDLPDHGAFVYHAGVGLFKVAIKSEFPQLLANSQYDEAARSAHGLRGVAATLGAKAIAAAAEQFEHGLRADPANADGAELTAAMDALIKGWDALADEQKTPTSS